MYCFLSNIQDMESDKKQLMQWDSRLQDRRKLRHSVYPRILINFITESLNRGNRFG